MREVTYRDHGEWAERVSWEPCSDGCEGWHVFDSSRGLEIQACDSAGRFCDATGVTRDDWAASFAVSEHGMSELDIIVAERDGKSVDPSMSKRPIIETKVEHCCMCGKLVCTKDACIETTVDSEHDGMACVHACQLADGRWVCSSKCWSRATKKTEPTYRIWVAHRLIRNDKSGDGELRIDLGYFECRNDAIAEVRKDEERMHTRSEHLSAFAVSITHSVYPVEVTRAQ